MLARHVVWLIYATLARILAAPKRKRTSSSSGGIGDTTKRAREVLTEAQIQITNTNLESARSVLYSFKKVKSKALQRILDLADQVNLGDQGASHAEITLARAMQKYSGYARGLLSKVQAASFLRGMQDTRAVNAGEEDWKLIKANMYTRVEKLTKPKTAATCMALVMVLVTQWDFPPLRVPALELCCVVIFIKGVVIAANAKMGAAAKRSIGAHQKWLKAQKALPNVLKKYQKVLRLPDVKAGADQIIANEPDGSLLKYLLSSEAIQTVLKADGRLKLENKITSWVRDLPNQINPSPTPAECIECFGNGGDDFFVEVIKAIMHPESPTQIFKLSSPDKKLKFAAMLAHMQVAADDPCLHGIEACFEVVQHPSNFWKSDEYQFRLKNASGFLSSAKWNNMVTHSVDAEKAEFYKHMAVFSTARADQPADHALITSSLTYFRRAAESDCGTVFQNSAKFCVLLLKEADHHYVARADRNWEVDCASAVEMKKAIVKMSESAEDDGENEPKAATLSAEKKALHKKHADAVASTSNSFVKFFLSNDVAIINNFLAAGQIQAADNALNQIDEQWCALDLSVLGDVSSRLLAKLNAAQPQLPGKYDFAILPSNDGELPGYMQGAQAQHAVQQAVNPGQGNVLPAADAVQAILDIDGSGDEEEDAEGEDDDEGEEDSGDDDDEGGEE